MLVDETLMRALKSGVDENDPDCMAGFHLWEKYAQPFAKTYREAMDIAKVVCLDESLIDPKLGRRFLLWAKSMAKDPNAILMGGHAKLLEEYRVSDSRVTKIFTSLDDAKAYKEQLLQSVSSTKYAEIMKVIRLGDTMSLHKISDLTLREINECAIFDPTLGQWSFFTEKVEALDFLSKLEQKLQSIEIKKITLSQKIIDTQDACAAWLRKDIEV